MKNRFLQIALSAIIACSCAFMLSAQNKLTPGAQLSLLQKQTVQFDSNGNQRTHQQRSPWPLQPLQTVR